MPFAASYKACYYPTHFLNQHTESTISNVNFRSLHIFQLNKHFIRRKTQLVPLLNFNGCLEKLFLSFEPCFHEIIFYQIIREPIFKLKQEFFFVMNLKQFLSIESKLFIDNLAFILIWALHIVKSIKIPPNMLRLA